MMIIIVMMCTERNSKDVKKSLRNVIKEEFLPVSPWSSVMTRLTAVITVIKTARAYAETTVIYS